MIQLSNERAKMRLGLLALLLLTLTGCTTSVEHQYPKEAAATSPSTSQVPLPQVQPTPINIADTLGVVVLGDHYGEDDFIRIYNQDGSQWYRFSFYYDDSDGDFEYANDDFRPSAFHPDYYLLVLSCVGRDKGRYEVIVNEETRLKKYVNVDDPTMKFETWKEHVLHVFSINFNRDENPPLNAPNGQPIDSKLYSPEFPISAVEVKGEWLRIKWGKNTQPRDKEPEFDTAWIRWKKDGMLLIRFEYLC